MEMSGQFHSPVALPLAKEPFKYPLDRRVGVPQNQPACGGKEKNLLPLLGIKPQFSGSPAGRLVPILT